MKILGLSWIIVLLLSFHLFAQESDKKAKIKFNIIFTVNGMTCEGCAESVRSVLKQINGVESYEVKFKENLVLVSYDPKIVSEETIEKELKKTDFEIIKKKKDKKVGQK